MSGHKDADVLLGAASDDLSDLDRATILRCIDVVAARSEQLKHKGLSSWTFFFGVTNLLLVTWCFGVHPEHFWIVYVFETLILFSLRWRNMYIARPLTQVLYWLDFCWVANLLCNIMLLFYLIDDFFQVGVLSALSTNGVRKPLFCCFFAVATGPLLGAVFALGNALVFHDADNTVSVFIHLCPGLLVFTMRWRSKQILEAWPGLFHLDYFDSISPLFDIYLQGIASYFVWFVIYGAWMLCCGLTLPGKGYDTVFHSNMRSSNPVSQLLGWSAEEVKRRASNNDFTVGSLFLYMTFHALAVCIAMLLSVGCFVSMYFHGLFCMAMALAAIYKGSSRYSYYMTENYTSMLRKEFGGVLKAETP